MFLKKSIWFYFLINIFIFSFINVDAKDSTVSSFSKQSKANFFTSFSFGMGINYSTNSSLLEFIEFDVVDYSLIPNNEKISDFTSGILFFGSAERQIHSDFSLKGEYSFFIKSTDIPYHPEYQYSYYSHQPMLILNYLTVQKHSYIKFGLGGGYFFSDFTRKYNSVERDYKSSGPSVKFEIVFNAQLGKNAATYFSGFMMQSFMSDLKILKGIF